MTDRRYTDAIRLVKHLQSAGYEARLAGGCVRDRLLGIEPNDYDIATTATPEQATQALKGEWKVVPTGLEHGTITVVMKHGPVEVTTLRVDVETDGRHAQVAFSNSFEGDAARRDFTVNAMFEDAEGNVFDYFGGQGDLQARVLRFVGDPDQRIQEDFLRILRLFRFWAKLGFRPAEETLAIVARHADQLPRISQERKTAELWKLFRAPYPVDALGSMFNTGVLAHVLPEFPLTLPNRSTQESLQKVREVCRPIAFMIWIVGAVKDSSIELTKLGDLATTFRMANDEKKQLVGWVELWRVLDQLGTTDDEPLQWMDRLEECGGTLQGFQHTFTPADDAKRLQQLARVEKTEALLGHRRRKPLPCNGNDVKEWLAIGSGPALGVALEALKRSFRRQEWDTKAEAEAWLLSQKDRLFPQDL